MKTKNECKNCNKIRCKNCGWEPDGKELSKIISGSLTKCPDCGITP